MNKFILTEDHIKLLKNSYVSWDNCEYGAAAIDCKRPYGNSDVESDIIELLWPETPGENFNEYGYSDVLREEAQRLHKETEIALQIVLKEGQFIPGEFERTAPWSEWKRVS